MTVHLHRLGGCAPTPLAFYLKALGVLRLVSEQEDANARGWWKDETFFLASEKLDRGALRSFLLESYSPTPMFNPWGARSGFYEGSSESGSRDALKRVMAATASRFDAFRQTMSIIREVVATTGAGKKPDDEESKLLLISSLRNSLRGASEAWLETVMAVVGDQIVWPAILGTGGSEGSGSYTAAYLKALRECLLDRRWDGALDSAVFGGCPIGSAIWDETFGQFVPTGLASPWDLLLAFEGACVIRSGAARRSDSGGARWMASPFFVAPISCGYASGAQRDELEERKSKLFPGRGEQWLPLWPNPLRLRELDHIFVSSRAKVKRAKAQNAFSMARAVASAGTSLGLTEFVRFGYQQRRNLATHLAIELGRFRSSEIPSRGSQLFDDVDPWLDRLRRAAREKHASARLKSAERCAGDAIFSAVAHPEEPARWQAALLAMAGVETALASGEGLRAGPVPLLRPAWVEAADDGTPELRLAVSFALQAGALSRDGVALDSVRRHWLPLAGDRPPRFATHGDGDKARLMKKPGVVLFGRDGVADALSLLQRRIIEGAQRGLRHVPLVSARRASADIADLATLVAGEVDLDRTLALARALMAIDAAEWARAPLPPAWRRRDAWPDDAWIALRLAVLPWPLANGCDPGGDPAIARRLEVGDAAGALDIALRRLRAAGLASTLRAGTVSADRARLWGAALAFPISRTTAQRFAGRLDPNMKENRHDS